LRNVTYYLRHFHSVELADDDANYASILAQQRTAAIARLHWRSNLYGSAIISYACEG
jgi:hypothetical protein